MGRIVVAEEKIFPEFVRLGKSDGYVPGLIIGQCSGQKDFIVHLAKTPLPADKSSKLGNDLSGDSRKSQRKSVEKLIDIQESWLVDHAEQVTRMLPGGMWVLGIFITGPGDVFSDTAAQSKVVSMLQGLTRALSKKTKHFGNSPSSEKLCLHLIGGTNKFTCKSLDVSSSSTQFRATDCKFTAGLKWHVLDTQYDFDQNKPLLITDERVNQPLEDSLQQILDSMSSGVQKSICTIDGEVKNEEELLDVSETSKPAKGDSKPNENKIFQVNLYIPNMEGSSEVTVSSVVGEMNCTGVLASRVFVHQKATVLEALKAVKEDIIRSFAARVEMHCDSLVEEEIGSPEEVMVVHEPPRRVLIPLPHSKVALSDYLFPGEGPSEALVSILDLIGVKVSESSVYKDFEGQPDQSDLYNLTTGADTPKHEDSSTSGSSQAIIVVSTIAAAFLVLLVSLFIQFYYK
ncbi:protein odr-4 homolog [Macrosteles quadrilineatus]|uniref:protein odr-4 homolog n=1 Tax=Macrosteles quadrilineatus TaxID=74068 RepID=UPI0023E0E97D|nr:protein odr-4 homolog [Macrosteles quadrilineatus]